jgi:uncharacterized protein involved in oxidation of intracellular sulfur
MNVFLILNGGPYGTERSGNGLRLALSLATTPDVTVRVFQIADAVGCAKPRQARPDGSYKVGRLLRA